MINIHQAATPSRMDRRFGGAMAEQGISQQVSGDDKPAGVPLAGNAPEMLTGGKGQTSFAALAQDMAKGVPMEMRKLALAVGVAAMVTAVPAAAQTDDPFAAIKQLMDKAAGQGANALDDAEAAVDAATEALSGDDGAKAAEGAMASPGMVTAGDPMSVVLGMQDYGLSARLEADDEGDPVIRSKSSGANTNVYFYGCDDNGQDCRSIAFSAGFELDAPFTADQANAWNSDKRFSKSYALEDGSAQIEMDVNLMGGGITAENFADVIDWWDYSVGEYKTFIGW